MAKAPPNRVGRLMCLALRHKPEELDLILDKNGWARMTDLLKGIRARGYDINRQELLAIVAADSKSRYALSPDHQRIRAQQGHSIPVDLGLQEATPPALLYHGTTGRALEGIFREGLKPMSRQHVHLSPDVATAATVGRRHGPPLIIQVNAGDMVESGERFLRSGNGVWLVDAVAPRFLRLLGHPSQASAQGDAL